MPQGPGPRQLLTSPRERPDVHCTLSKHAEWLHSAHNKHEEELRFPSAEPPTSHPTPLEDQLQSTVPTAVRAQSQCRGYEKEERKMLDCYEET